MRKTLYIDLDNVLVDFPSAFPRVDPELLSKFPENRDDIPGIFSLMEPMPHALEAFWGACSALRHVSSFNVAVGQSVSVVGQTLVGEEAPRATGL